MRRRIVVVGRPVAGWHDGARDRPDAVAVDHHVDRDDDHEDQRQAGLDEDLDRLAGEGHDLARAAGDALADRLQRGLALLLDLQVDAVAVQPVLQLGQLAVGIVDVARDVALEARDLVGDRVREQEPEPDEQRHHRHHHDPDRGAARDPQLLQQRHERVQQQRDQPGDDEQQQDAARRSAAAGTRRRSPPAAAPSAPSAGPARGAMFAGGAGVGSFSGGDSGPASPTSSSGFAASSSVCRVIHCQYARITAILFIGDVVGRAGRRVLRELLPALREELAPDFVVVNGENAAGGHRHHAQGGGRAASGSASDAITLGNHTFRHREVWPYLEYERRIVRPVQLPAHAARAAGRRSSSATGCRWAS